MLTQLQHQPALCIPNAQERASYRTHMCGLCHALGDKYGQLSRLLTTREMILLNLLTTAQTPEAPSVVQRRCPINPLRTVNTNQNIASDFAAAASVELAQQSFADDLQDSAGINLTARSADWILRKVQSGSRQLLAEIGFETETLTNLNARQSEIEAGGAGDPTGPTAAASAKLFAMTAQLAGTPENAVPLAAIGASYGSYVYLTDAYRDYADDMVSGDFNPLRHFSQRAQNEFTLSQDGLAWLLDRFTEIQSAIRQHVGQLTLYRHQDTIARLLCKPVDKMVQELSQRADQPITYQQWTLMDALRAAFFLAPATETRTALFDVHAVYDERAEGRKEMLRQEAEEHRKQMEEEEDTSVFDCCDLFSGNGCCDVNCVNFYGCNGCDSNPNCYEINCFNIDRGGCEVGRGDGCGNCDCGGGGCGDGGDCGGCGGCGDGGCD